MRQFQDKLKRSGQDQDRRFELNECQTIPQTGEIYSDSGNLAPGHRAQLSQCGTWFGFSIDRPRLVLL